VVRKLWSSMQTWYLWDPSSTARSAEYRNVIKQQAFHILRDWYNDPVFGNTCKVDGREVLTVTRELHSIQSLMIAFGTEEHAGVLVNRSGYYKFGGPSGVAGQATACEQWVANSSTGAVMGQPIRSECTPTSEAWYQVQANRAQQVGVDAVKPTGLWSDVYPLPDDFYGMDSDVAWSFPITPCGHYSCFQGVVAASVSLRTFSTVCMFVWYTLSEILQGPPYQYTLSHNDSSVFLVRQFSSRSPDGDGVLMGASHSEAFGGEQDLATMAAESPHRVTRLAAEALLWHFGGWNATEFSLPDQRNLTFRYVQNTGDFQYCDQHSQFESRVRHLEPELQDTSAECYRLGIMPVTLGTGNRWLAVTIYPLDAFSRRVEQLLAGIHVKDTVHMRLTHFVVKHSNLLCLGSTIIIALICVWIGACLSRCITHPLEQISRRMRALRIFKFTTNSHNSFEQMVFSRSSHIREVAKLQKEYVRLARGMEAFAHFVPETIVKSIVRGDERAARLHVERRIVTVLFSDIRDFTSISEKLTQDTLLSLLTEYLSEMTEIVESNDGVVAEVHGDGVLAFWNTPDRVEDHATKACGAALSMHSALGPMNMMFRTQGLPELTIRVGVHTGEVYSGNLGSERKMKFGCVGEAVNVASHLEELCKLYGTDVLCSGDTREQLKPEFMLRSIDRVRLKGREGLMELYEVIGKPSYRPSEQRLEHAKLYEQALLAFREARFAEAAALCPELLLRRKDKASELLRERANAYVGRALTPYELEQWTGSLHCS